jgi:hypothetical protein
VIGIERAQEGRLGRVIRLPWNIIAPVGLVALALVAVAWLDVTKGGEATPAAPLGEIGTPVRGAYIAPTATPFGFAPTPKPRPTPAGATGANAFVRDEKRRSDLLLLLDAASRLKAKDGAYPSTSGNLQSLCTYKEIDQGCKIKALAAGGDAIADPAKIGYWYSSDGTTAKFYASLEGDVPKEQQCVTSDAELKKHDNVICVTAR